MKAALQPLLPELAARSLADLASQEAWPRLSNAGEDNAAVLITWPV